MTNTTPIRRSSTGPRARQRSLALVMMLSTFGSFASACTAANADASKRAPTQAAASPTHADRPTWNYDELGPETWGNLSREWESCRSGHAQSPIDIPPRVTPRVDPGLRLTHAASGIHLHNNGHTVRFDYDPGSSLTVDGSAFELRQFHFHTASEHTIAGKSAAMELHFVHSTDAGELAVLAVLVQEGAENPALRRFAELAPRVVGGAFDEPGATFDARELMPSSYEVYEYDGSLTTPPCSEGVHWYVLARPITADRKTIAQLTGMFGQDHRPVMPLYGREVRGGGR